MKLEVYAVKLDLAKPLSPAAQKRLLGIVSEEKRGRLARIRNQKDRMRILFGDLLVRSLIREKTGLPNYLIRFGIDQFGKPFLSKFPNFHFNISHSGDWVVVAVDEKPVGIDVERIRPIDLYHSMEFFSPRERRDLKTKTDPLDYFYTLWCIKESYVKRLGTGLNEQLSRLTIRFGQQGEIEIQQEGKAIDDNFFYGYHVDNDYQLWLCASHKNFPERAETLSMEEIMKRFNVYPEFSTVRVISAAPNARSNQKVSPRKSFLKYD